MDKIRDALLRAREDKGFRASHPVQDLPDAASPAKERSFVDDQSTEQRETPPQDRGGPRDGPAAPPVPAEDSGVKAVPAETKPLPPPPPPPPAHPAESDLTGEATAVVLPDDPEPEQEMGPAAAAAEQVAVPPRQEPQPQETPPLQETSTQGPVPIVTADAGTLLAHEAVKRDRILSKSRFPRVLGTIAFAAALLAGVHFFVEPLNPYLEIAQENLEMVLSGLGPVAETIGTKVSETAGNVVSYLEGLIE